MKKFIMLFLVVCVGLMLISTFMLSSCKEEAPIETTTEEVSAEEETTTEEVSAEEETITEEIPEGTVLRIAAFEGGFGGEWIEEAIRVFKEEYPGVEIEYTFDPNIHEQLQPLFVAGDPPDVCAPGGMFDIQGAIKEGQVMPLEDYLNNSNAKGKDFPWIETFDEGTFSAATVEGHTWYMPLFSVGMGWWYNETIWNEYNWSPPKTWEEAFTLFDKMKSEGIGPIANQGIYPLYIRFCVLPDFIAKLAGPEGLEACWNLEPDSWTNPEVIKAFEFIDDLAENYFQEGNLGMNHTQSQAEVMVGNAGMIACGTWFPKEMEEVWPEGDEIRAMAYPPFEDSAYPQKVFIKDHDTFLLWIVPSAAKQPELAIEFLKILYSEQVQKYTVEVTGTKSVYKGSIQWLPDDKFGRAVKSLWDNYEDYEYSVPEQEIIHVGYPTIATVIDDNIGKMFHNEITPEDACAAIQQACDEYRSNTDSVIREFSLGLN